ncbi:serine/threonine-protein kinase [Planctomycetota bacterium]|nr:serine/threonine-protein kinase [Planctomycetota bacterium]
MAVSRYDKLFAHVASITGLMSATQVQACFSDVESGQSRDLGMAASKRKFLAADVTAALGILASELTSRRIAEGVEPGGIVASGANRATATTDSGMYPKALGNYFELTQIARGAMGVIFKGKRKSDDLVVALKVLPSHMVDQSEDVERFKREIDTITSLVHPNIVRVLDHGQQEDFYFYVMEYIDGLSLRELIRERGHLSPYQGVEIVRDTARGVSYAHKHGVVHRDIKPSNVMMDSTGAVKLVDFGLAFRKKSQIVTATGISLGTPAYMSPEQIEEGREAVSEQSDIYSLGVTLFEAVTGERPFEGDNQYDVMKKVLFDAVPRAHDVRNTVPIELSRVIEKCMARSPADRFVSADSLIEALDGVLQDDAA